MRMIDPVDMMDRAGRAYVIERAYAIGSIVLTAVSGLVTIIADHPIRTAVGALATAVLAAGACEQHRAARDSLDEYERTISAWIPCVLGSRNETHPYEPFAHDDPIGRHARVRENA